MAIRTEHFNSDWVGCVVVWVAFVFKEGQKSKCMHVKFVGLWSKSALSLWWAHVVECPPFQGMPPLITVYSETLG